MLPYENGRGPCLDAALTGETVVVDVFADDSLYPDFAYSARRAGVTHSVSVDLPVPQRVVGTLNLYASTSQPLAEEIIILAQAFASYAGVAVANAALFSHTAELAMPPLHATPYLVILSQIRSQREFRFPRWWRLGLAITEAVLAAGLIVAAVTEGSWYWWAGAIAAATLALINLSVYLLTRRKRRNPPEP